MPKNPDGPAYGRGPRSAPARPPAASAPDSLRSIINCVRSEQDNNPVDIDEPLISNSTSVPLLHHSRTRQPAVVGASVPTLGRKHPRSDDDDDDDVKTRASAVVGKHSRRKHQHSVSSSSDSSDSSSSSSSDSSDSSASPPSSSPYPKDFVCCDRSFTSYVQVMQHMANAHVIRNAAAQQGRQQQQQQHQQQMRQQQYHHHQQQYQ
ncbi:hypothetical protein HK104_002834, partial [Borealophlyctis nickersoniae]